MKLIERTLIRTIGDYLADYREIVEDDRGKRYVKTATIGYLWDDGPRSLEYYGNSEHYEDD